MKNMFALIGAALVVFAGLGWYLGWYRFSSVTTPDGHQKITVDLDREKIGKDVSTATTKIQKRIEGTNPDQPTIDPRVVPASGTDTSNSQQPNNGFGTINVGTDGITIRPNLPSSIPLPKIQFGTPKASDGTSTGILPRPQ